MQRLSFICIVLALITQGTFVYGQTDSSYLKGETWKDEANAEVTTLHFTLGDSDWPNTDPFRMIVIGDSIAWGCGLYTKEKYHYLVADWLQKTLKRPVEVTVLAHTGATITKPTSIDTSKHTFIDPELGSWDPTLLEQANHIPNPEKVDLILVSGGINDLGLYGILLPMDGYFELATFQNSFFEDIRDLMNLLLRKLLNKCDGSMIIVTGYYPIASTDTPDSSVNELTDLIKKNDPKWLERRAAEGLPLIQDATKSKEIIVNNCAKFDSQSRDSLGDSVDMANIYSRTNFGKDRVYFAPVDFPASSSYGTNGSWLWELTNTNNGGKTNDHKYYYRVSLCDRVPCNWDDKIQAMGHPNAEGDQQYYSAIKKILEQRLSDFGSNSDTNNQPSSSEPVKVEVVSSSPPTVQAFRVTPQSLTLGESFAIDYIVSDNSGSGLKQVELWRKDEMGDWQEIKPPNTLAGENGPISGSFTNAPAAPGKYWYGMHVVDNAGNWNDERNSNTNGQPRSFEPAELNVADIGKWTETKKLMHDGGVCSVSFSPDGSKLATGSVDNAARIWDVETGTELQKLVHEKAVGSVSFSPDGSKLATGCGDNTARIWDVETGVELKKLVHEEEVYSVSFSPDGSKLATGSVDNSARIWNTEKGEELKRLVHNDTVWAVSFSPDGRSLATACADDTVRIWDVATGIEMQKFTFVHSMLSVSFSPDGSKLATGSTDGVVRVVDVVTGLELNRLMHNDSVFSVSFRNDGNLLATASDDNTSVIWDAETGAELQKFIHNDWVRAVSFCSDSTSFATGCFDSIARIWNFSTVNKS